MELRVNCFHFPVSKVSVMINLWEQTNASFCNDNSPSIRMRFNNIGSSITVYIYRCKAATILIIADLFLLGHNGYLHFLMFFVFNRWRGELKFLCQLTGLSIRALEVISYFGMATMDQKQQPVHLLWRYEYSHQILC